ncbi:B3 DNA binding domain [Forsythia ovata]|uniref:B3 DNA binding domain n=1 Tax=Forsythia ovata TaxID=205694 RepID=A0ABD1TCL8_9LAMI
MNRPNAANEADDEVRDELYHNRDDFWNTVEIARDDDVVFPETNATQRPPEIVQDNEEEFPFTNDDLIASVSRSNQAGPSSRSSLRPRTVDESACEYLTDRGLWTNLPTSFSTTVHMDAPIASSSSSQPLPSFQITMSARSFCHRCIYVPGTFARTHLPRFVNEVQIHDAAGRVWQIGLDRRGNGIVRRIARGWAAFYSTKNISPGDTCVFELINSDIPAFNVRRAVIV